MPTPDTLDVKDAANVTQTIGAPARRTDAKELNPDATSGSEVSFLRGLLDRMIAVLAALPASLGPKGPTASLSVVPSTDQNPILDHANAVAVTVTTSSHATTTPILTVPAGCYFVRVVSDADFFLRTDGTNATTGAGTVRVVANVPEVFPVAPAADLKGLTASGSAAVRVTPYKAR